MTLLERYGSENAFPVHVDAAALEDLGCRVVQRDLLDAGTKVRHAPRKLARAVLELAMEATRAAVGPYDSKTSPLAVGQAS